MQIASQNNKNGFFLNLHRNQFSLSHSVQAIFYFSLPTFYHFWNNNNNTKEIIHYNEIEDIEDEKEEKK